MQRRSFLRPGHILRVLVGRRIQAIEQIKRDLAQLILHRFVELLGKFAREDAYPGTVTFSVWRLCLKMIEAGIILGTPGPDAVACGLQFLSIDPEREPVGRIVCNLEGVFAIFENVQASVFAALIEAHGPSIESKPAINARNWYSHRVSASFSSLPGAVPNV